MYRRLLPFVKYSSYIKHSYQLSKRSGLILSCLAGSGVYFGLYFNNNVQAATLTDKKNEDILHMYGKRIQGLPEYSLKDVAKHASMSDKIWVAYKSGVYDITEFINQHPGGKQILIVAGSAIDPFWTLYAVHKSKHVLDILEKYRIGNLIEEDVEIEVKDAQDPYAKDPKRHSLLKPSSVKPYNAEPPPYLLSENLITPNELFYVRNHLPVPTVEPETYELEVEGMKMKDATFSLKQLKKFPKVTITASIQCGGNRRSEMTKVKQVRGLSWGHAAISNAEWSGVRLRDVLLAAGIKENNKDIKHIQFEGLDTDTTNNPYGASIPIEKAMDPNGDVILAYEMNGETLPADHGFPIRVVVPGVVGARSVKWLGRIIASDSESTSHWQQNDYKGFAPNIDWDTVDFSKSLAIQEMPVTSAICSHKDGGPAWIKDGKLNLKGYAYSGGGRKIYRVDVSVDGGKTWREVDGYTSDESTHPRSWGWTLWTASVPVDKNAKEIDVVVKAVDSNYNTQPSNFADIWNLRGVLSNAYHRITLRAK